MAWQESDRVSLRRYLGFPALWQQAEPRLESAINAVQSLADGGSRPDGSTETMIRGYLTKLASIETQLESLWAKAIALKADEVEVDAARATMLLRSEGRRLVGYIADSLGTKPRRDVFSSPAYSAENPFSYPVAR